MEETEEKGMVEKLVDEAERNYEYGKSLGEGLEEKTHLGEKAGDFLYEHSDPQDALNAANHFDDASDDWSEGNYGSAVVDAAEGVGSMIKGVWDALWVINR